METIFCGRAWKFGDDIDTDTIIPGKRGTIPDIAEMKQYAFELLRPEFGAQVQEGDILVAGSNFGCGSSREQAASVLAENGVRCIIAKSFARIFFRNAFNSGILPITCDGIQAICQEGDTVTVEVGKRVSVNGHTFPIAACPEHLSRILESGGLIQDTKRRIEAGESPAVPTPPPYAGRGNGNYTMAEKLLMANTGATECAPGDILVTHPEFFMIHDIYTLSTPI